MAHNETAPGRRGLAGACTVSITPTGDVRSWGSRPLRRNEREDSDLLAHAVAFSDGRSVGVIASLDLTMIERGIALAIREACAVRTGIPAAHITLAANHVHLAPAVAPGWVFRNAAPEPLYVDLLRERVVEAVEKAYQAMRPACYVAGNATTHNLTFNRRYLRPDGGVKMVFAPDRAPAFPPAGAVDPTLGYILFEEPDGAPIALVASFSAHNHVVGGSPAPGREAYGFFHRDFGGRFGDVVRQRLGLDVPTAYLAGACGDASWQDPNAPPPLDGPAAAWRIGARLADAFLGDYAGRARKEIRTLRFARSLIEIPDRPLEESGFCDDDCRGADEETRRLDRVRWPAEQAALRTRANTRHVVEIGAVALGDAAISTNPAELFVQFGLDIKRRSPFKVTLVAELANGHCGYVPTEEAFAQGGYETHRSVYVSHLAKSAGRTIADESVKMLEQCASPRGTDC